MLCPECSAENPDNAQFCTLCYFKFPKSGFIGIEDLSHDADGDKDKKMKCPNCGIILVFTNKYCGKCGFIFEDRESLLLTEDEVAEELEMMRDSTRNELQEIFGNPKEVSKNSDGTEIMREIKSAIGENLKSAFRATGRDSITYIVRILASIREDAKKEGFDFNVKFYYVEPSIPISHIDDVSVNILISPEIH